MKMFATAASLVGWCGLKPRNDVSNGRFKRQEELKRTEAQIKLLESYMVDWPFDVPFGDT